MEPEAYDELYVLEDSHWWYKGMRHITRGLLERSIPRLEDLCILDAGCGTGGNLAALADYGHVYGFDFSPLALKYSQKKHDGQIACASIEATPYPSNTFDLVTSFDVIVCHEVRDDMRSFRELARVTKPGGHILIRVAALPALRGPHDTVVHGARRYTAPVLKERLIAADLEPVRITYANSILLPLVFASRKLGELSMMLGREPGSDVSGSSRAGGLPQRILDLEAAWIRSGRSFPLGVSIFALARKPENQTSTKN